MHVERGFGFAFCSTERQVDTMALDEAPRVEQKDWRDLFSFDLMQKAEKLTLTARVSAFTTEGTSASAIVEARPGMRFSVHVEAPASYYDSWDDTRFSCSCLTKRASTRYENGRWVQHFVCQHEAAVLLLWEEAHGPWLFTEPPEAFEARMQAEREKAEAKERERRRKEEKLRLRMEKERKENTKLEALSFFPGEDPEGSFFQFKAALSGVMTNQYAAELAALFLKEQAVDFPTPRLTYSRAGEQMLAADATVMEGNRALDVVLHMHADRLSLHRCNCSSNYYYIGRSELCAHELAALAYLREYIRRENPGDVTDRAASAFFEAMDSFSAELAEQEPQAELSRPRCIELRPKLVLGNDGELSLSYKIGRAGGKQMQLRSYSDFLRDLENHGVFSLSKTLTLDFGAEDLTEDSLPWLTFLQRRISEAEIANSCFSNNYYYTPTIKVKTRDALLGAHLDRFYELAEGTSVEFSGPERSPTQLRIGHSPLRVSLRAERIAQSKTLRGVRITGKMPVILRGSAGSYVLGSESLSKITREEEQALLPFRAAADTAGNIRFSVGKDRLAEFYYRVIPQLTQNAFVDLDDPCAEEVEALLPPEPHFSFRLDIDFDHALICCETLVQYGEATAFALPCPSSVSVYRDAMQEKRVQMQVAQYFRQESDRALASCPYSDDAMYRILSEAVPALSRYGTVEGSSSFSRSTLRPMPQLRVGVSVESGLLEIELLSKDMTPEELLAVLESYRQKKRFHRLRSGAYLELDKDHQLSELEALSTGADFSLEDAIRGGATVPAFRSLYLDKLLEAHDAIASDRDRSYRALIKNFLTIRDADYEVPAAQADILRPYQTYGYKWLRTLAAAGFGGILADEMGLGKTLQFISLAQTLHDAGELSLGLVVCPASLVYNWQEEFIRFAPSLNVQVVSGTAAVRKKLLSSLADSTICVTSYDSLRQDIAEYQKLRFDLMVLDEAQYIKNQKASMTKAVKAVSAKLRFALTGTPIENRLAELWSIFDYLMPGFLYRYPDFARRFETPITKQKDAAATEALKQMTAPFILRRVKKDVLKDLPSKLEEVRYTRFDKEQRQVYDGQVVRMKQLVASSGNESSDKLRLLAELTRIRQICCDPSLLLEGYHDGSAKREACMELIQNAMGGGHRMLVFSQFTSMLELLEKDLNDAGIPYFKLTGATPKEQRVRLVREFNEGTTPVFLISLKAGGTGLNLTGADVVIHYDPWWNLAAQNQATDRAHRIGQTNQVTVYKIIVKDSIEERILALQEAKRDLAEAVLSGEGKSLAAMSKEELLALLG